MARFGSARLLQNTICFALAMQLPVLVRALCGVVPHRSLASVPKIDDLPHA